MAGLFHAIRHYKPKRGIKFSTYATPCILGYAFVEWDRRIGKLGSRKGAVTMTVDTDVEKPDTPMRFLPGRVEPLPDLPERVAAVRKRVLARLHRLYSPKKAAMAMGVLFDQRRQIDVAADFGCSRMRVWQLTKPPTRDKVLAIIREEVEREAEALSG